jgi:hypothetical protein
VVVVVAVVVDLRFERSGIIVCVCAVRRCPSAKSPLFGARCVSHGRRVPVRHCPSGQREVKLDEKSARLRFGIVGMSGDVGTFGLRLRPWSTYPYHSSTVLGGGKRSTVCLAKHFIPHGYTLIWRDVPLLWTTTEVTIQSNPIAPPPELRMTQSPRPLATLKLKGGLWLNTTSRYHQALLFVGPLKGRSGGSINPSSSRVRDAVPQKFVRG